MGVSPSPYEVRFTSRAERALAQLGVSTRTTVRQRCANLAVLAGALNIDAPLIETVVEGRMLIYETAAHERLLRVHQIEPDGD